MGQVNGMYEAKEERMKKYLSRVMCLVKRFEKVDFVQIPREENVEADTIAKEASANESMDKSDEVQYMPSIDRGNWMAPIISYLKDGRLPEEKDEARKLRVRSARYVLMNEVLYKRGFSQPYLRCLASDKANYVSREVHEGAYGNYSGARSLVHKVVAQGITGQTCKLMLKHMLRSATSANGLVTSPDNHQNTSPRWWHRGPLHNGD